MDISRGPLNIPFVDDCSSVGLCKQKKLRPLTAKAWSDTVYHPTLMLRSFSPRLVPAKRIAYDTRITDDICLVRSKAKYLGKQGFHLPIIDVRCLWHQRTPNIPSSGRSFELFLDVRWMMVLERSDTKVSANASICLENASPSSSNRIAYVTIASVRPQRIIPLIWEN